VVVSADTAQALIVASRFQLVGSTSTSNRIAGHLRHFRRYYVGLFVVAVEPINQTEPGVE
jgi:hypothetical protein